MRTAAYRRSHSSTDFPTSSVPSSASSTYARNSTYARSKFQLQSVSSTPDDAPRRRTRAYSVEIGPPDHLQQWPYPVSSQKASQTSFDYNGNPLSPSLSIASHSSSMLDMRVLSQNEGFLRLPREVLDQVLEDIFYDPTSDTYTALMSLRACLLISRQLYWSVLQFLCRHIPLASPNAFNMVRQCIGPAFFIYTV